MYGCSSSDEKDVNQFEICLLVHIGNPSHMGNTDNDDQVDSWIIVLWQMLEFALHLPIAKDNYSRWLKRMLHIIEWRSSLLLF